MKRIIKTVIISSIICSAVFSTFAVRAQFSIGARAGANLATLNGNNNVYHRMLARFYGGLFANYKTTSPFALQLELNYVGAGANLSASSSSATNDRIKANYLAVPLLAQYKFRFGGYIELGPQLGFLLSANEVFDGTATDIKQNIKSTDFEGVLGLGYELNKTQLAGLGINIRWIRGITDISKTPSGDGKITNRGLNIGLTYRLGQHK
ncbi:MAG: porin family protein [Chitinophagaceae bacterium]